MSQQQRQQLQGQSMQKAPRPRARKRTTSTRQTRFQNPNLTDPFAQHQHQHNQQSSGTCSMATFFRQVFGCCLKRQRKPSIPGTLDEESRLIPDTPEPIPPLHNAVVIDSDRMKERLKEIVRSKEGKMVNVNAQLPFNLHNRVLSTLEPSSSRSASLSSSPNYSKRTGRTTASASASNGHRPNTHHHLFTNLVYNSSPSGSKPPSPARHPSPNSSRKPSPIPTPIPDSEGQEEVLAQTGRNPILNVRLVTGSLSADPDAEVLAARGRSRAQINLGENASPNLITDQSVSKPRISVDKNGPSTIHSPTIPEFIIQDVGALSRSWGD